ncbi:hypothetical protein BCR34DRAFT_602654 [Clohesyomyces aquaticus]|uniref:Uncharacterized protein n=1 Tax=Clohesyomyces aquaticus TaxID=1231657 RepID=A0A1Y1ZHB7_9PLEO|nr:hypothetical protein BCR34DRAFT_602654 [Clohesyomyces aquaticus]
MSDIERSFTYLYENISSWCASVTEIQEKVTVMQNEIAKMPASGSQKLRRKTGSVESIRDLDAIMEQQPSSSAAAQSSPAVTRKRKTPSLLSGHYSGPSKFRSRRMIIVYYDGQIQKSFETLVRNIGTGRNMLRKGKMAAKMEALAELAGSENSDDDDEDPIASKIAYRRRAGLPSQRARALMRGMGAANGIATPTELFETTDKALELAQGLVEKAAHQSLRDGDCRKELEGVRKHFEAVLETATQEVAKYKARKESEAVETPAPAQPKTKPAGPSIHHLPSVPITTRAAIDIEVDDDDEEETDFVMPPVRFTSRR